MTALWVLLALLIGFIAALLIRTALFRPKAEPQAGGGPVAVDEAGVAERMRAMIRVKTVSSADKALEDPAAFDAFPKLLETLYPKVHECCLRERIGDRGLLYLWKGRAAGDPAVLMAHYDVVPAEAALWRKPPFDAVLENGVIWGRGTLDTKGTLLSILEAAEALIAEGFMPATDVYFAFGGDEEIAGGGAPGIVAALSKRGVRPAFVLDEGGAVVEGVFPGVRRPCALIGTGEKGSVNMRFTMRSKGGHASAPPPRTTVGLLARAVAKVEDNPFPFRLTPPARAMFDTLGRHSTPVYRLIFANLWCFSPLLNLLCKKTGGEMNALVRTTCAFTQMRGGDAPNVLPPVASVGANLRLIAGDTMDGARARLAGLVGGDIEVSVAGGSDPSPDSRADGAPWDALTRAIRATWPDAIVSPYLMIAASDSRHYAAICDRVYRFSAMALSAEERKTIHGNDERVPVEKLCTAVRFYRRVIEGMGEV